MRLLLALLLGTVFAGEGPDPLPTAGAAVQAVAAALQGLCLLYTSDAADE